jgi:hypothetical protein
MNTNLGVTDAHIVVGDYFVSEKVSRIVEAIRDYEPLIEVQWLPPTARQVGNERPLPAFKLVYHDPNTPPFILFHVNDEKDFDERVLRRIIANDQRNGKASLSEYEAWEEARRLVQKQVELDKIEAVADIAAHVLKSPLNTYRVNKDMVIKDGVPYNAAKRKD